MMSPNLSREKLDILFKEIAKQLKKKLKGKRFSYELIVVGGASILLNYSFRMSTIDIDCLDLNDALMNEIVNEVSNKYQLPNGWINTDFTKTNSYSPKLIQYSSFYKSFANNTLIVRTIKDEYLIAMKMIAARKYKHDYSDIFGIIKENSSLTYDKIISAVKDLYGDQESINLETLNYVQQLFRNKAINYEDIKNGEAQEKEILLKNIKKSNK